MKFKFAAATAALVALSVPAMSSADDGLKYADLVHCAATNMVVAGVLSLDDGKVKNKDQINTINGQAAALMAIAAVTEKKEVDVVKADADKETDAIIEILKDKSKSSAFIETEVPKCNTLGQAAVEVINDTKKSK